MKKKVLISLLVVAVLACTFAVSIFATTDSTTTEFKISQASLTLGTDLRINFKVSIPSDVNASTVKLLVWEGDVASADKNYTADTKTVGNESPTELTSTSKDGELYVFTFSGINATEMGKYVYVRAYYQTSSEAAPIYTETKRFTIAEYLDGLKTAEMAKEEASRDAKLLNVLNALMAYGDAAQELGNVGDPLPKISDGVVNVKVTNGTFADGFTEGKFLAGEKLNVTADPNSTTTPTLTAELGAGFLWTTEVDEVTSNYSDEATATYSDGIYVGKYENAFKVTVGETSKIYTDKTLAEAVELANNGTLTLLGNVDLGTASLPISGSEETPINITLDLNGKTITSTHNYPFDIYDATLTVKDGAGGGSITTTGDSIFYTNNDLSNLKIESGTFASGTNLVYVVGGTVNINGGTFTGNNSAVFVGGGTVNISGGTFTGGNDSAVYVSSGEAIISGGTFTSDSYYAVRVENGEVTIEGGEFTGNVDAVCVLDGTVNISGGTFKGGLYENTAAGATLNITGGTFNTDPSEYVDETAAVITENGDGTWTVTPYVATVTVGEGDAATIEKYTNLETAFTAVNTNGGTITLLKDVDWVDGFSEISSGKTVTLELNGYEIKSSGAIGYIINNYGNLTIQDSSDAKTGKITSIAGGGIPVWVSGGTVNITGGTFTSGTYAVRVNGGEAIISGGTFTSDERAVRVGGTGIATISGGTFKGDTYSIDAYGGTVNIEGGTFDGALNNSGGTLDITGGTFNTDPSKHVVSGYAATANEDGTYTVTATSGEGEAETTE